MPRAPAYQPNQVNPVQTTNERLRPVDNGGGVLGAVGQVIGAAGAEMKRYAEEMERRDALNDDTAARDLLVQARSASASALSEYTENQGSNAVEAAGSATERLTKIREEALAKAKTPRERAIFERLYAPFDAEARLGVEDHSRRQAFVWRTSSLESETTLHQTDAVHHYLDPETALKDRGDMLQAAAMLSEHLGESPEAAKLRAAKLVHEMHYGTLDRMHSDPFPNVDMISAYIEANKDEMLDGGADAMRMLQPKLEDRAAFEGYTRAIEGLQPEVGEPIAPGAGGGIAAFKAAAKQQESGGNPGASNSKSSASGLYGFTDDTFVSTYQKVYGSGQSRAAILAKKGDAAVQEKLMDRLTADNAAALAEIGEQATAGNLYVMHHMGRGDGTKVLQADPNTPMSQIVSAKVIAANPHMRGKTAGEFVSWAAKAMGGSGVTEAPRQWNKDEVYNRIDALAEKEGWSFEYTEAVKARADKEIARDEQLLERQYRDAGDAAAEIVLGLGDKFTDISQLPKHVRDQMNPTDLARYDATARENKARAAQVQPDGPFIRGMNATEMDDPYRFAHLSKQEIVEAQFHMTPGEYAAFVKRQAEAAASYDKWTPADGARAAINKGTDTKWGGVAIYDTNDRYRVYNYIAGQAREWRAGNKGREPTEADYDRWFRDATQWVMVGAERTRSGNVVGGEKTRAFDVMSSNYVDRIVWAIRTARNDPKYMPSEQEIRDRWNRWGEVMQ